MITLAIPSKGRLKEQSLDVLAKAGLAVTLPQDDRKYRARIDGLDNVEVAFLSASEIAGEIGQGAVDLGITGEDLLRENLADWEARAEIVARLGFGHADVVVAVPDIWLEWESTTLIVDAKYKRHWEELQQQGWSGMQEELREQHRNDLLQVLAYANLARTGRVIACLAYPCSADTWESLRDRGRLIHRADVIARPRSLQLWLTAVPMSMNMEFVAGPLAEQVRAALGQ